MFVSPDRPSKYRYVILALLCFLAMITYMDRAANGSAKADILNDLNQARPSDRPLDLENDFFIVLMAFQLAYALFEIPSGWLGDTVGPRLTLLRVVLWWSVFVALTGFTGQWLFGGLFFVGYWSGCRNQTQSSLSRPRAKWCAACAMLGLLPTSQGVAFGI